MSTFMQYPQFPMNAVQLANQNCLYGKRTYTQNGKTVSDFHYGIDLMGANNGKETIVAPADGKCIYLTENDGTGSKTIVLAHGGLMEDGSVLLTKHAHCDRFLVKVNEKVTRNQAVAIEGMTGNASGPHDHTETWIIPPHIWFNGISYYTYSFADQKLYAKDPLTIYRLYPHQEAFGFGKERYLKLPQQENKIIERVQKLLEEALALLQEINQNT